METFSALLATCAGNSPVNSPHKGQWRGALMFSLICAWINKREAGDLRRKPVHYDVIIISYDEATEGNALRYTRILWWESIGDLTKNQKFQTLLRKNNWYLKEQAVEQNAQSNCWWIETPWGSYEYIKWQIYTQRSSTYSINQWMQETLYTSGVYLRTGGLMLLYMYIVNLPTY